MKKIFLPSFIFLSLISFSACNNKQETPIVSTQNEYIGNVEKQLNSTKKDFDYSFKKSKTYDEFILSLENSQENSYNRVIQQSENQNNSNTLELNTDEEIIFTEFMTEFTNSLSNFETIESDGTKAEFLIFLNSLEEAFRKKALQVKELDLQKRQLLEAQVVYSTGLTELFISYEQAFNKIVDINNSGAQKVIAGCNWWCRNKRRITCIGLSAAAATSCIGIAAGCVPCAVACQAATVAAAVCWNNGGHPL